LNLPPELRNLRVTSTAPGPELFAARCRQLSPAGFTLLTTYGSMKLGFEEVGGEG
jgi:hypothetical protein